MKNSMIGAVGVILLVLSAGATGEVVSLPLNCSGFYDINTPAWTYDFDLGVTFSDITNVSIDWSGEITAGLAVQLNPQTFEPIGDPFPNRAGVYSSFYLPFRSNKVLGGAITYPNSESFDTLSEISGIDWSDLLDGQGNINIGFTYYGSGVISLYTGWLEFGNVNLNDATLLVEGTIVPEPATLLFLSLGIFWIRAKRREQDAISKKFNDI